MNAEIMETIEKAIWKISVQQAYWLQAHDNGRISLNELTLIHNELQEVKDDLRSLLPF